MRSFFDISVFSIELGYEVIRDERRGCVGSGGVAMSVNDCVS